MGKWVLAAAMALVATSAGAQEGPGAAELKTCAAAAQKADWQTVISSCEKALGIMGKEHVGARYYLGKGYIGTKQTAKGVENLTKFLELAKGRDDVPAAFVNDSNGVLGKYYFADKKYAQSIPYLEALLATDRNDENMHYRLAIAAQRTKNTAKAEKHFNEVIRLDPTKTDPYYYAGRIAYGKKQNDKARQHFEKFVELKPGDPRVPQVQYMLCGLTYNAGDHPAAQSYCDSYMASGPKPGSQTDTVKQILEALKSSKGS